MCRFARQRAPSPAFVGCDLILWPPACEEVTRLLQSPTSSRRKIEIKKEQINASCKTWNQTARQAQKDIRPRQRLLPYKIQAVPVGQRSRRARVEVCILRTQAAQAAVPLAVDRAHRRRRKAEWDELQPV